MTYYLGVQYHAPPAITAQSRWNSSSDFTFEDSLE